MGKRVLVTGATGFVGANLTRRLLLEGHDLHVLVRPNYSGWRIQEIRPHIRLTTIDLSDDAALTACVAEARPDWVFHLAAHGAYSWQSGLRAITDANWIATANLLTACLRAGFECFVHTGSSSEYGPKPYAPVEQEVLAPNSVYAVTKAAATHLCSFTARQHRLNLVTLRLYSVYGPWEDPGRLIPRLIVRGLEGRLPPLVNPEIARDFVYTEDVVEAYLLTARHAGHEPGAVYNICSGGQTTIGEVVSVARDLLGIAEEPVWNSMADRAWDTTVWVGNNQLIREALGWRPSQDLRKGLRSTMEWYRELDEGLKARYRGE